MISVLMPVYNAAATLRHAVASVSRQSGDDWELVAVDDGSTDGSGELLAALSTTEPRLRVFHRPHEGLVAALNAGLAACRGAWLARFDADDLMHRDRLRRQRDAAFDGVLGCGVAWFPRETLSEGFERYLDWLNGLVTHEAIVRDLFVESPFAHPSVMLPTALLREVGGYRDVGWPEDYDLWLRLWRHGARFAKLPQVLHYWRDHPSRLSRGGGPYRRAAFRECKMGHLRETFLSGAQEVVIWGSGEAGKVWSRLATRAGLTVVAHLDFADGPLGERIRGVEIHGPEKLVEFAAPVLVTVGVFGRREATRQRLAELGRVDGRDYVCVG